MLTFKSDTFPMVHTMRCRRTARRGQYFFSRDDTHSALPVKAGAHVAVAGSNLLRHRGAETLANLRGSPQSPAA
ncbi:hypothetical protein NicSoilC12_37870 [Arthrobacter sp. NicSoilC12]|nr:hypothetical protein NicSoilC12_37870 [Arthrobacter sp. NicSoilC12]